MRNAVFFTLLFLFPLSVQAQTDSLQSDFWIDPIPRTPTFPGGDSAMKAFFVEHLVYPKNTKGVYGKVYVTFLVEKDGRIDGVELMNLQKHKKRLPKLFEQEALRVVRLMPRWEPAKEAGGKPMKLRMTLPVVFSPDNQFYRNK